MVLPNETAWPAACHRDVGCDSWKPSLTGKFTASFLMMCDDVSRGERNVHLNLRRGLRLI